MQSSLPAWLSWEPSDLNGVESGSPPWDLAYFECLWSPPHSGPAPILTMTTSIWWVDWLPLLMQLKLPIWLFWEPFDPSGLNLDSPLWLTCKIPLGFPAEIQLQDGLRIIWILCTVDFLFDNWLHILFSFMVFFFYSIIVQYSDTGNVFQIFPSRKHQSLTVWVNKHHRFATTRLDPRH
jgi:hypothetical protein